MSPLKRVSSGSEDELEIRPRKSYSVVVQRLLQYIIDETNKKGHRIRGQHSDALLGWNDVVQCLYRGHADMPTELKVRDGSESGALALREFKREIGKIENEWTLTDEIARKILEMLQQGEILFDFDI